MKVIPPSAAAIDIGITETTPTVGIKDYSRRVTDDFGVTTVVKRAFARTMSLRFAIPSDQLDAVTRTFAALRATPAQWVADERFAWLNFEGFYKDFEPALSVGEMSYCTLTVEGLAETETVEDAGEDPAPSGASTMLLLRPVDITPAELVASSVAENDYPAWAAGTTYAAGARVILSATHRIYESVAAGNVGNDPTGESGLWIDVGPTKRWAMFDQALGTVTSAAGSIIVTLAPGAVDALALLDVVGATARVQTTGYDRTIAIGDGAVKFLDMPGASANVLVTISGPGTVSVGTLLVGTLTTLGITGDEPTTGITDYSRKDVDDFGEVTIVERSWAKRMSARTLIRTDALDIVANRIASVRATPSLWIARDGTDALTVYGFFKDFSIEVDQTVSTLSLSIEGLSKAAPLSPGLPPPNWTEIVDNDPVEHPKPEDGATVGAPAGTPVGDRPAETLNDQVDAAMQGVADLFDTYGDTASAAASAAAASVAEANAAQARDDAQAASFAADAAQTASETARNLAQSAATAAGGSASAAAGSASTASTKATEAGNSATSASGSANTATTKAGEAAGSASAAAGSASAASTSATNASNSASAANSAKVAAESARDDAAGSASAAATSASTAATKASDAGTSASAAAGSATTASTAAGTATTKASEASTSATNAAGSASTASSQATLSANSANAAQKAAQATLPSTFEDGALYFKGDGVASVPTRLTPGTDGSYGPYLEVTSSANYSIVATKGRLPCATNQKWKIRALLAHVSGTPTTANGRIENYAAVSGGAPTSVPTSSFGTVTSATPTWFESPVFTVSGPFICPAAILNYLTASAIQRCYALELIDVDAAEQAAASAAASLASSSVASTKADAAGVSATAANTAKIAAEAARDGAAGSASVASGAAASASSDAAAATTQAGLSATYRDQSQGYRNEAEGFKNTASSQAGTSTSQAAIATAAASAAQASAILSASIGNASIVADPGIDDYPSGTVGQRPSKWFANSAAITNMQRVADAQGGYSVAFDGPAAQDAYIYSSGTYLGTIETGSYYVVELDVELVSGALTGAAFGARSLNSSGADLQSLFYSLSGTQDANGNVIGVGATGKIYRWRKLIKFTTAGASGVRLFAFSHLTGFGSTAAANRIIVHKLGLRVATPSEIRDQTVLAPMEATVAVHDTTLATLETQMATRVERVSAGATSAEIKFVALNSGGTAASSIGISADRITLGTMTSPVLTISSGLATVNADLYVNNGKIIADTGTHMKVIGKGFGTSSQFVEWFGPKMAFNLCSEANAITYIKTNGDAYFGGTLSAGTLTNKNQASDLTTTSSTTVGPFGTNGNPIVVAFGWTYRQIVNKVYTADSAGIAAFNADVSTYGATGDGEYYEGATSGTAASSSLTLARTVSGSTTNVAAPTTTTRNTLFQGFKPINGGSTGSATIVTSAAISATYTDSAGGTADRTFTATLARGYTLAGGSITQRVSITTTEE